MREVVLAELEAAVEVLHDHLNDGRLGRITQIDYTTIPGWVAVADVDYNDKPELNLIRKVKLIRAVRQAGRLYRERPEDYDTIEDALYDTLTWDA